MLLARLARSWSQDTTQIIYRPKCAHKAHGLTLPGKYTFKGAKATERKQKRKEENAKGRPSYLEGCSEIRGVVKLGFVRGLGVVRSAGVVVRLS